MKKMRRICLLFLFLLLIDCTATVPRNVSAAPIGGSESCIGLDAGRSLAGETQLLPSAKSVILFAPDYSTMVYSWNPDEKLDPSGMNKIMTALLALETGNLEDTVEVTEKALSSVASDALKADLKSGEKMTLRDLVYLMMVGSANDAAAVIAEHIAGDQGAFVIRMNQRAKELGCTNTNFLNSTGLSAEGQMTTARDLAKITTQALTMDAFVEIFAAKEYTVAGNTPETQRHIETTNYMMCDNTKKGYLDQRITGGKTGAYSSKDRSLISTAEKDGVRYLAVLMSAQSGDGSTSKIYTNFTETQLLLDHAYAQYAVRQLLMSDRVMEQFQVINGENDLAVSSKQTVSTLLPIDVTTETLDYRFTEREGGIAAPVSAGEVVGSVQIWHDGICVVSSELISVHPVREKGTAYTESELELKGNTTSWGGMIMVSLVVFVGALLLVVAIPVSIRLSNMRKYRNRRRKTSRRRR